MKTSSTAGVLFLCAGGLLARPGSSPQWGDSSTSAYVVSASDMTPTSSSGTWETFSDGRRYFTGPGAFYGGVHVPQGAMLTSIELDACDDSDQGFVSVGFFRTEGGGLVGLLASVNTGQLDTPGCGRFAATVDNLQIVDNGPHVYHVVVHNDTFDGSTSVNAVRVFYKLQVSPAPGTPSFADVPASDPAYQFIEALVASGVTAGCGGGNYCPDAPLTRRQMAVFLAKALGLSWAEVPAP